MHRSCSTRKAPSHVRPTQDLEEGEHYSSLKDYSQSPDKIFRVNGQYMLNLPFPWSIFIIISNAFSYHNDDKVRLFI